VRVAFYAPLKPPSHPVPSGDRRVGRELMRALALAGHDVALAARLRSWEGAGDKGRQSQIERRGGALASRLIRSYRARPETCPDLWLTYHLYHKAPDWLGPAVTQALAIPYVVAEAALAAKQAHGPWAAGYAAARAAVARADALIQLNGDDHEGLLEAARGKDRIWPLAPFLEIDPYAKARRRRGALAACYGLGRERPWLLTVAMMREGAKLASYRVLADALGRLGDLDWQLVIVGDGPARAEVEASLAALPQDRVRRLGTLEPRALPALYAAADLYLWPAVHEAFGMAFLEAQAAGLPVVAGRERGVPELVRDGESGLLVPPRDGPSFAAAVRVLLQDVPRRAAMARRAREVAAAHDIGPAAARLDGLLRRVAAEHRR
jgi:glycosyltransferase involved in cell wall biosynthesis